MSAQSNTPEEESFGGIADNDYLYPSVAPTAAQHYSPTPNDTQILHDQTPPVRPSDLLDWITAGQPNEVFNDRASQFFTAIQAKTVQIVVSRYVSQNTAGSLVYMGEGDLFGFQFNATGGTAPIIRDGIDASGQPLYVGNSSGSVLFGKPGIHFYRGIFVDWQGATAFTGPQLIFTLENKARN